MIKYRYRSDDLIGPWRFSQQEALGDAVADDQAELVEGKVRWRIAGLIETRTLYENPR